MAKYKIISDGNYIGLKDSYKVGEQVVFKFPYATDTSYDCTINGCSIHPTVQGGCLVYDFIMPERDVEIKVNSRNTMYIPVVDNDDNHCFQVPHKPGAHGLKSIQICRICGKKYVKDYIDQNCCLECMENQK